ncbi:MAG TPA: hypothetical protein DEF45_11435, partial [Rhodopirellula sp.]|nr:hypothetical protein [Rhodopirellula sp.]
QAPPLNNHPHKKPAVGILMLCVCLALFFLLSAFAVLRILLSSSEQHLSANEKVVPTPAIANRPIATTEHTSSEGRNTENGTKTHVQPEVKSDSQTEEANVNEASKTAVANDSQNSKVSEIAIEPEAELGVANDKENPEMDFESETPNDSDQQGTSTPQEQEPETQPPPPVASPQTPRRLNTGAVKKTSEPEGQDKPPIGENNAVSQPADQKEFSDRVEREGGKSGEFQITLIWNNINDLDLHLFCPSREHIYYMHPNSRCGAALDIDMNASQLSRSFKPVENIVWANHNPASGRYAIWIKHFATHGGGNPTAFKVLVKQAGKTRTFSGRLRPDEERFITFLHTP